MTLPEPARYTPWLRGLYDVSPGLRPLGTDFGNGAADRRLFQIDAEFPRYAENKRTALRERRGKYVRAWRLSRQVEDAAIRLIVDRLSSDYPDRFRWESRDGLITLYDGETRYDLSAAGRGERSDSLDFLARLVQEDFALVATEDSNDWVAYLHLCSPSHWAAEEKIGRSFFDVHEPIPGFERVNAAADGLIDAMIRKGPFVRFVWGIESDDRLNHHPEPPSGFEPAPWQGRRFDEGRFWVRTERQAVWGMPEVGAALFVIRVGYVSGENVMADETLRAPLVEALKSMSPEARRYKGLDADWDRLMKIVERG